MDSVMDNTLGSIIAARRTERRLTLKQLGVLCNVSPQYLHDIERDRRTPSLMVAGNLATALGLDYYYLMALARMPIPAIENHLNHYPMAANALKALIVSASEHGFVDWGSVKIGF